MTAYRYGTGRDAIWVSVHGASMRIEYLDEKRGRTRILRLSSGQVGYIQKMIFGLAPSASQADRVGHKKP